MPSACLPINSRTSVVGNIPRCCVHGISSALIAVRLWKMGASTLALQPSAACMTICRTRHSRDTGGRGRASSVTAMTVDRGLFVADHLTEPIQGLTRIQTILSSPFSILSTRVSSVAVVSQ